MTDKQISALTGAAHINTEDLLVIEQYGVAKKLTGETLVEDLKQVIHGQGYATFQIDPVTGHLIMRTPDPYTGPQFTLTETKHLEVRINA